MARYNTNRYQYETSPRKLQPEYRPEKKRYPKKSTAKKQNANKQNQNQKQEAKSFDKKIIFYIIAVFAVLFAVSYRNAFIAQTYSQVKDLKSELAQVEKENKQLEINIESQTNFGAIEEKAKNELGLDKLKDSQIVYVSLDKQDYVESSEQEVKLEEDSNWFESIIRKIKNIF